MKNLEERFKNRCEQAEERIKLKVRQPIKQTNIPIMGVPGGKERKWQKKYSKK